jgi:NAD(P)-dependent dehydrogenase (short-subunit alcohol dehydrogenase family)
MASSDAIDHDPRTVPDGDARPGSGAGDVLTTVQRGLRALELIAADEGMPTKELARRLGPLQALPPPHRGGVGADHGGRRQGRFLCSQAFARRLVKAKVPGTIVNMSSITSEVAIEYQSHYCASKDALHMLTKAMALELADNGITVNAVGPGVVETGMTRDLLADPAVAEVTLPLIPLDQAATPENVAAVVAFLASPGAAGVTGATLLVDGGYVLR